MFCSEYCRRRVSCTLCFRMKAPRGRSVSMETTASYCMSDCPGYWLEPQPGHLWPGEDVSEGEAAFFSTPHTPKEGLLWADFNNQREDGLIRLRTRGSLESIAKLGVQPGQIWWLSDGDIRVRATIEKEGDDLLARPDWDTLLEGLRPIGPGGL